MGERGTGCIASWSRALHAPPHRRVPRWLILLTPHAAAMMTVDLRASNAKAKAEVGWEPAVPNYVEGISRLARTIPAPAL